MGFKMAAHGVDGEGGYWAKDGERCQHCLARHERGDDGMCNSCGKQHDPVKWDRKSHTATGDRVKLALGYARLPAYLRLAKLRARRDPDGLEHDKPWNRPGSVKLAAVPLVPQLAETPRPAARRRNL